jgi:PAS domain S-box-containing protein
MNPFSLSGTDGYGNFEVLWKDGERVFCRGVSNANDGDRSNVLAVFAVTEHPTPATLDRLAHEYGLKDALDSAWAARPLKFIRERGRVMLVLEDPGGEPLDRLLGAPMETDSFLRLAISIAVALGKLHRSGLIHKDLKPTNVLVKRATGEVRLTGFGLTSRLPRERQAPDPPESIAGTLAYMAPEQTGRMNRSIDSRSDLYALGVTLYQMLTGALPFAAADPMEWIHCHIARRPVAPSERLETVPSPMSQIIMKLLAKTAEDRYQTAAGVEQDLRRCLIDWAASDHINDFRLGERDMPDRLLIPEKLYGRAREVDILLASFDRIVAGGKPELVLVSGYSGIGKSSVVNELHKPLVPPRGLFASGKFDQYKRDIPYATLAQAFQSLIRPILAKSEGELAHWRDAIREALDPNGQLLVDLVPELKLIIGEQQPVPELPQQEAQARFNLAFRRFIGVFAQPEHPLALFLDDLQWLDAATLDLMEDLLTHPDAKHLLLIGAYRDNEVDPTHPLMRKLQVMREAGALLQNIVLAPLTRDDLEQLIADTLHCERVRAASLAELVEEKTTGNPFFAIQFVSNLFEEGLLTFDHVEGQWHWDLNRIHAKGYTDNVVELMVGRLNRLPLETQTALQQLACLGNSADFTMLRLVYQDASEQMHGQLWEAVRTGLIFRSEESYTFLHDRVQEAAYSLIPENSRAEVHLSLGRLLAAHTAASKQEETIFEIVNQYNRGVTLVTSREEREQLAELNLIAGKRARASTAYASGLKYLTIGAGLLADDCWQRRHELIFPINLYRAECEFLTGDPAAAAERLALLAARATNTVELATVTCLWVDVHTTLDRSDLASGVCLDYLRHLGIEWSPHPDFEEVRREYERIWPKLGSREIGQLIEMPLMSDASSLATLDVLTKAMPPALFTDQNLHALVTCGAVNLSLDHGNGDASSGAYVWLGVIAGPRFGNYKAGFEFGQLAYQLVEQLGFKRFQAATYMLFGNLVIPWTKHIRSGQDLVRRAFEEACKNGDLTFAGYSCNNLNTNLLASGDPLPEIQREAENGLAFAQRARFGLIIDIINSQLGLIRTLRGLKPKFGSFDDEQFNEVEFEAHLASNTSLAIAECWYWVRKLQARFFCADYSAAIDALRNAERLLWTSPSLFEGAEAHFYGGLSHAACWDTASPERKREHFESLVAHQRLIETWAANCPENFENRAALVGAEIARIEGRDLDSMRLYEKAIRSARANGFVYNEALGNELAGRFYMARGFEDIAHMYLRNARYYYLRWGADGKARQLYELYPNLREDELVSGPTKTIGTSVEQLDLATVIKVSQAVSGEIVLEKLLDTLMRTAMAQAGAERVLLVLARGAAQRIAAEALTTGDMVTVQLRDDAVAEVMLPESVLQYVLRTQESVILDDAAAQSSFAADPYIRQRQARSVLCLPLLNQAKLIGVLYLENNLAPRVFAPTRLAVLKLLASQAAISLENTRLYRDLADLYRDLAEREAKVRRLVEANIIGIYIFSREGVIVEANQAFLKMVGYDRDDLLGGRLRWTDLTPPEWHERTAHAWEEIEMTGAAQPYEKEYFRKDGGRVPVLTGSATFDERRDQGVAFVLDLSERRRAEAEARESEQKYREMQMELAHANRVVSIGQLTASIAHEVKQPIAAAVAGAQAARLWLNMQPANLAEVGDVLLRVVREGQRAGDIIDRTRDLIKKAQPRKELLNINEAIREVIELARGETIKNGISVRTNLEGLQLLEGDRVQLQQVILNLVMNAVEAMKATSEGAKELSISTRKAEPDVILVVVRDSGPGLAPATLDRLFDAFYTTKPGGLGLGLSICRSIIETHGGRLSAKANLPRGAIFEFSLPSYRGVVNQSVAVGAT